MNFVHTPARARRWIAVSLMLAFILLPRSAPAETMPTIGIIEATVAATPACLFWAPVGVCLWMTCTMFGCSTDTSVLVFHYNPDLVVGVFNGVGENPWSEMEGILGGIEMGAVNALVASATGWLAGGGVDMTEGTAGDDEKNLMYRETDVIGHPVASAGGLPGISSIASGLLCPSAIDQFTPYFLSATDAIGWRFGLPDGLLPQSWVVGLREIGSWPSNTWGGVYPRHGWVTQMDEAKGAAVLAQRAGDIVTRSLQPHVYNKVPTDASTGSVLVFAPGELKEGDPLTGIWQMLLPVPTPACEVFGTNDTFGSNSWGGGRQALAGDFMWNLWRPYQCCKRAGTIFLGVIGL